MKPITRFISTARQLGYKLSIVCVCIATTQGCAHAASEPSTMKDNAEQYVQQLDNLCTYDDGYTCLTNSDAAFTNVAALDRMIPANYLSSWPIALAAFQQLPELNEQQKKLMHYKVGFIEDEQSYQVMFSALLMPYVKDGKASGISSATFGKSVQFSIDKKTLTVQDTRFFK